jgi:hypothetical protein
VRFEPLLPPGLLGGDFETFKDTPEYKRWQAICDVGPLEYPLSPGERARRDAERAKRQSAPGARPPLHTRTDDAIM